MLKRGFTLAELMVSLTICGVALSMIASVSARQQRVFADLADRRALTAQLQDASVVLPIDLRSLAPAAGDIRDARDTALEIRSTIASTVVCDGSAASVVLAPAVAGAFTYAAFGATIEAGDTLWLLAAADSDVWQPYRIAAVSVASAGQCASPGPVLSDSDRSLARASLTLSAAPAAGVVGMPGRVTRPVRYSIYRASDGAWYLGEKDWSNAQSKFNTIQPVAGPFLPAASGGLVFRYSDSTGATLPSPVADRSAIALIRVELRGQTANPIRALGSAPHSGKAGDSAIVVVSLRNRR